MAVREGLLALVCEWSPYGYQLKVSFRESTGGISPLNVGPVAHPARKCSSAVTERCVTSNIP